MTYTITPLLTGVRNPDQGIMTYQQGYGKSIWLPIWAFLVEGNGYKILVDTGLDENEFYVPEPFIQETGLQPSPLVECLEKYQVSVNQIEIVLNTHLHDDHCGNNLVFENASFYCHKSEFDFCHSPHPIDHRYDTYFIDGLSFSYLEDGDEIVEGIRVTHSPGHTPGCLSVCIETSIGHAVITGFCCNNENFPPNGPAVCPGVHLDAMAAWESIQKIKEMGATILPMHEISLQSIK